MLRIALVSALAASASSAATELTEANYDELVVKSGKAAFIKFLAPWWGHCKKMKPDWDSLAASFEDSKKVIIADVDCTAGGKPLCDKFGVRGYPTIKYFNPPDEEGEDYKGGRDLAAMKKFAESELGPGCSVDAKDNCSEQQLKDLEQYIAMPADERETKMTDLKAAMKKAEDDHNELLKGLQSQFKESQDALEKLKEESAPVIKLLKAATPSGGSVAGKDEV